MSIGSKFYQLGNHLHSYVSILLPSEGDQRELRGSSQFLDIKKQQNYYTLYSLIIEKEYYIEMFFIFLYNTS